MVQAMFTNAIVFRFGNKTVLDVKTLLENKFKFLCYRPYLRNRTKIYKNV